MGIRDSSRRWRLTLAAALLISAVYALELKFQLGGASVTRTVDDVGESLVSAIAGAAGLWRGLRLRGRARASWLLLGAAGCCWAAGDTIWTYLELVHGDQTPFPSLADVGYLLFPLLAVVGLLVRPSAAFAGKGRFRILLDGILISSSLFLISWATTLGVAVRTSGNDVLSSTVSLAYPATDLVVLTIVIMVVSHARAGSRVGMVLLASGLACLSFADSGFTYLDALGKYQTGNPIDLAWMLGLLLLIVAAAADQVEPTETETELAATPRTALLLPYLPAAAAICVTIQELRWQHSSDSLTIVAASLVALSFVGRQLLVLLDNRALIEQISYQAFHDQLTGLANRALFNDRLAHALDLHTRDLRPVTVLLLDLDDFKSVNDSYGHPAGDELLLRISERLRGSIRAGDTVARLGGDEFAILIEDGGDSLAIAQTLLDSLSHPVNVGHREVLVRASIGVAALTAADPATTSTDLMQHVDVAMYAAKRAGKATAVVYSSELDHDQTTLLDLRLGLLEAVSAGTIDVAYQPSFTADHVLCGFEALARWSYRGEAISPAVFIPIAQALGCVPALDVAIMDKALAFAAKNWPMPLMISVNFDIATLDSDDLVERVAASLRHHDVDPSRVIIEILETDRIEANDRALATIRSLRELGIKIAVDDFGVGYASLARLCALAPDIIKIDRSLVVSQASDELPANLLSGIIDIAHRIGADVVAEGVETVPQLDAVRQAGCDVVQGYLWGHPRAGDRAVEEFVMPAVGTARLIARQRLAEVATTPVR